MLVISHSFAQKSAEPIKEVILKSEVKWDHLNPKRGDLAPKAGTLWGDRNGNEPDSMTEYENHYYSDFSDVFPNNSFRGKFLKHEDGRVLLNPSLR